MNRTLSLLISALLISTAFSQGGTCSTAIPQLMYSSCLYTNHSLPALTNEKWFEFTATDEEVNISLLTNAADDDLPHVHTMILYGDGCGTLTQIDIDQLGSGTDDELNINATGLIPGDQYLLLTKRDNSGCPKAGCTGLLGFNLCVFGNQELDLGTTATFGMLAGQDIITHDNILVVGDIAAAGAVNGSVEATGTIFTPGAVETQSALDDLSLIMLQFEGEIGSSISPILDGQVFTGGVYNMASSAQLGGVVTLNGDELSRFTFIIDGDLNVTSGSIVKLNGVSRENVNWVTLDGGSFEFEEDITFMGHVFADGDIVMDSRNAGYVSLSSLNGSIELYNDDLNNLVHIYSDDELIELEGTNFPHYLDRSFPTGEIPCYSEEQRRTYLQNEPQLQSLVNEMENFIRGRSSSSTEYIIPVVVHVIHDPADPLGVNSNIEDDQILNQIEVLNLEFSDVLNSAGEDMNIKFCLAQTEPDGITPLPGPNPALPGILRVADPLTSFDLDTEEGAVKALSYRDSDKYLNIWVVSEMTTVGLPPGTIILGEATPPWLQATSPTLDGVLMRHDWFGNATNTLAPTCPSSCITNGGLLGSVQGKVVVHEVGHYLGLFHTFQGGCGSTDCTTSGDLVCDTPPVATNTTGCPGAVNTCTIDVPDLNDQVENHMDYSDEFCHTAFTAGQRDRMHLHIATFRSVLVDANNLLNTGISCAPSVVSSFTADQTQVCNGDLVQFTPVDLSGLTYDWDFGDGNFSSVVSPNHTYTANGNYTVSLTVSDGTDNSSTVYSDYIYVFDCNPIISDQGHWYFGEEAGLDFSSGTAVADFGAFLNSTSTTPEGVVTQSDPVTGNLSFYAGSNTLVNVNDYYVWDGAHNVMAGSLPILSDNSSSQFGLSVPNPDLASPNTYYVFTTRLAGGPTGFNYSIIDVGLGTVGPNFPVTVPVDATMAPDGSIHATETITAIPKCNGMDYWIIVHGDNGDPIYNGQFLVYSLTSAGITFDQAYPSGGFISAGGELVASPDGSQLAFALSHVVLGKMMLYDFDRSTGAISNAQTLTTGSIFGASFSPDSRVLYGTRQFIGLDFQVLQYDVTASSVSATEKLVGLPGRYYHLQLGPDDKLYVAKYQQQSVAVINYPNQLNTVADPNLCGFNSAGVSLVNSPSDPISCRLSLPNFMDAKVVGSDPADFSFTVTNCNEVTFDGPQCYSSYSWDFDFSGTGAPSITTSSVEDPPTVIFGNNGTHTIQLTVNGPSGIEVVQHDVVIGLPNVDLNGPECVLINSGIVNYSTSVPLDYVVDWDVVSANPFTVVDGPNNIDVDWSGTTVPGTVTMTVTDPITGCSEVVVLVVNPIDENITVTNATCVCDGALDVSATGPQSPFTYSWGGLPPGPAQTAVCPGTYLLTVTDALGCVVSTTATVDGLAPDLQPSFFISPAPNPDYCMGDVLTFNNTSSPTSGVDYIWDFGDGNSITTTSIAPINYTYTSPGTFQVSLSLFDPVCGGFEYATVIINVATVEPGGYNDGCCSNGVTYHSASHDVSFGEVWQPVSNPFGNVNPILISGTVTISAGESLTIASGQTVEFGPYGKIVVQRGGTLVVDEGTTLTGLSSCGTMWQGIEVWGNHLFSHSPIDQPQHGSCIVKGATIERAHVGVLLGRTLVCFEPPVPPCPSPPCLALPLCPSPFAPDAAFGGGILQTDESTGTRSTFSECGVTVKFTPFESFPFNASSILNTDIDGGVLPDPGYLIGNALGFEYPNVANPYFGSSTATGRPSQLVYNLKTWGVQYHSSTFTDAEVGIESINSFNKIGEFDISSGNTFQDLTYGFLGYHTTNAVFSFQEIEANIFSDISKAGIRLSSGQYGLIHENDFTNTQPLQSDYQVGIHLANSVAFRITDNDFLRQQYGIVVTGSDDVGGYVGSLNRQNGNELDQCSIGIVTFGLKSTNELLQLRCNTHNNPVPLEYQRNWLNFGTLADQGSLNFVDDTRQSGNEFNPGNPTFDNEVVNAGFFAFPPVPYIYYRHDESVLGTQSVTADPIGPITINNTPMVDKTPTSCDFCSSCLTQVFLDEQGNELSALQNEYDLIFNSLDGGGNTAQLLYDIENASNGQLKNTLKNNSPLSDEVLDAYFDRNVPAGHFKQVMELNLPVSRDLEEEYYEVFNALPNGIKNQLAPLQISNDDARTLTAIEREAQVVLNDRQLALNSIVVEDMSSGLPQDAIDQLEAENTNGADLVLTGTYLSTDDLPAAQTKLDGFVITDSEDQNWHDLQSLILDLYSMDNKEFDIDETQEAFVRALAEQTDEVMSKYLAQSFLRMVFKEEYEMFIPEEVSQNSMMFEDDGDEEVMEVINLFPNPAQNNVYIDIELDENEVGVIEFYDVVGALIIRESIPPSQHDATLISLGDIPSGIYTYTILVNGANVYSGKLVVGQ